MEAGNRGAAEMGGISVGLNISLPFEQHSNPYITEGLNFNLHYFSIRKMHFMKRAKALGCFPGGFGTMDEFFESLTLIQTKKIRRFPIVLFGSSYWQGLLDWIRAEMLAHRTIAESDLDLFHLVDTPEAVAEIIGCYVTQCRQFEGDQRRSSL